MRYQKPISNPWTHYWEEELFGFWGDLQRLKGRFSQSINLLSNRIVMANSLKRTIDILGAIFGLVISSPIWLIVPIAIKLESTGPVLYTQQRVGKDRRRRDRRQSSSAEAERRSSVRRLDKGFGKPFHIIKFRTMCQDAESATGPVWATKQDARITKVGKFLRKTRIDEIPQLFNILMGDMSLVGPRPERQFFIEQLLDQIDNYEYRLKVKPGLTGLAQVEHKYDENIEDVNKKIDYDLKYIREWNLIKDIKIIFKTVIVVVTAKGM